MNRSVLYLRYGNACLSIMSKSRVGWVAPVYIGAAEACCLRKWVLQAREVRWSSLLDPHARRRWQRVETWEYQGKFSIELKKTVRWWKLANTSCKGLMNAEALTAWGFCSWPPWRIHRLSNKGIGVAGSNPARIANRRRWRHRSRWRSVMWCLLGKRDSS